MGENTMHMADALISPAVGGVMWAASAGTIAYCSIKVRKEMDDKKIPLMGVLAAFIFAAQMINFTIPVTGSSGHLGGGMILTILLGPYAAFLAMASVLTVQALFFADGGLLALGCNIFNLGIFPAFIAYPLIYKKIVGDQPTQTKIMIGAMVASIVGLQMGAFGVVLQTVFSGISSLPFSTFVVLMQPIHLGIGIVEGLVTASVISFVYKARPELVTNAPEVPATGSVPVRNIVIALFVVTLITGGFVSWFASEHPDGLEWSIEKVTGKGEVEGDKGGVHGALASLQEKFAFLPDYNFKKPEAKKEEPTHAGVTTSEGAKPEGGEKKEEGGRLGTSVAGLVGGLLTLGLAFVVGLVLKKSAGTSSGQ
jgi:cobalt/nickel transport system permease protein